MIVLAPMTGLEFEAYLEWAIPAYAQDKVESGQWAEASSLALSRDDYAGLLPNGLATPENVFYTLRESSTQDPVGLLWYATQERAAERIAYVYDFLIEPPYRRRGYGSQAFDALEADVASRGLNGIALHVFGHNTAARAFYAKLGYRPTNINLFKTVSDREGA